MAELLKKITRCGLLLFTACFLAHCAMGGTEVGNPRPGAGAETSGDEEGPAADEVSPSPSPEGELILEEDL